MTVVLKNPLSCSWPFSYGMELLTYEFKAVSMSETVANGSLSFLVKVIDGQD